MKPHDMPPASRPLEEGELEQVTGGQGSPGFPEGFGADMEELVARMTQQRQATIETQIGTTTASLSDSAAWTRDAAAVLEEMRHDRPAGADGEAAYGSFVDHQGRTQDVKAWMEASGIAVLDAGNDGTGTADEFGGTIANLRQGVDAAAQQQTADMIRLERLLAMRGS